MDSSSLREKRNERILGSNHGGRTGNAIAMVPFRNVVSLLLFVPRSVLSFCRA